jgi:hypothetical protein
VSGLYARRLEASDTISLLGTPSVGKKGETEDNEEQRAAQNGATGISVLPFLELACCAACSTGPIWPYSALSGALFHHSYMKDAPHSYPRRIAAVGARRPRR